MRVYIKDVPTIYRDFFNEKIEFVANSHEEAEDILMALQDLADQKLNDALENGELSQADWDNAPTYETLAEIEEEDEKAPRKMELTEKDIETIKKGGPAPFTIQELADAQGMTVKDYAKDHGISPDTARGWASGRPIKPFILAALYFWDKSAGILRDKSQKD